MVLLVVVVVLFCDRRYGDGRNPRFGLSRGGVAPNGNFLRYFGWREFSDPRRSRLLPSRPLRRPPREYNDDAHHPVVGCRPAVDSLVPVLICPEPWLVVVLFSLASASTERYVVRYLLVECVEYILFISSVIHPNNNNDEEDDEDDDEEEEEEDFCCFESSIAFTDGMRAARSPTWLW